MDNTSKSKMTLRLMASNNIFYILEINKFDELEIRKVFNKVLKMRKDRRAGRYF